MKFSKSSNNFSNIVNFSINEFIKLLNKGAKMNLLKTNWEDFGLFLLDKAITILLISILFLFSIKPALVSLNAYLKIIVSKNGQILREF